MSAADESREGAEQKLREIVRERVDAVHAKDPAPLAAREAPDIVTFDVLPPLHARGWPPAAGSTCGCEPPWDAAASTDSG